MVKVHESTNPSVNATLVPLSLSAPSIPQRTLPTQVGRKHRPHIPPRLRNTILVLRGRPHLRTSQPIDLLRAQRLPPRTRRPHDAARQPRRPKRDLHLIRLNKPCR